MNSVRFLKFAGVPLAFALSLTACSAGSAASPLAPAVPGKWELVWEDDFAGPEIDRSKWAFDVDCWGGGNAERQCYTDRSENAAIVGGNLVITALKEDFTGPALPESQRSDAADPAATVSKPFTSARLVTRGKAAWKYGRIEVRARLPQGQGTWPAIWMLPEDYAYGSWAASGEIDIMEAVNLGVPCAECPGGKENTVLGTLHFGGQPPDNALASTEWHYPPVLDGFHTFAIIWQEGKVQWLVDGTVFATKSAEDWFSAGSSVANAPFDQRFHLILNLAIGGGLPEGRGLGGVSEEGFPKQMQIDWVKVWRCNPGAAVPAVGTDRCPVSGSD